MSDAIKPTMKVSREGIVLIKSFEGFRPRAVRRENGGWVIGYGHTLSAREGASVSEADAELLLRYDLIPVETTVNQVGAAVLNQHQFDAMTSFAFSVGVDRFRTSDVSAHLSQGAIEAAANALMGWPEPALPQVALRRRAAERALFVAEPGVPVAVSDLLVAPVAEVEAPHPIPMAAVPAPPEPLPEPEPEPEQAPLPHPRAAAVSALLGEVAIAVAPDVADASGRHPSADLAHAAANDVEANTAPAADVRLEADEAPEAPPAAPETESPPQLDLQPERDSLPAQGTAALARPAEEVPASSVDPQSTPDIENVPSPLAPSVTAFALQRYAPYSAPMFGPLPFLQPAVDGDVADKAPSSPASPSEPAPFPPAVETPAAAPGPYEGSAVIQPFALAAEGEPLVLSASEDAPAPAISRQTWTPEERLEVAEPVEGGLFGEDLSLTLGGAPIMRHGDIEVATPAAFDWSETGAFIIMGAVGLTAFGAAMAAFRLASEQTGGNETTIIAWVLAVIGAGCVGVSSFNLYRRWGLPGGDN